MRTCQGHDRIRQRCHARMLQASEAAATRVFQACIAALWKHEVLLEAALLKPQMVVPGDVSDQRAGSKEIAAATLRVLRR